MSAVGGVARVNSEGDVGCRALRPLPKTGIIGDDGANPALVDGAEVEPPGEVTGIFIVAEDDRRKKGIEDGVNLRVVDGLREGLAETFAASPVEAV